MNCSASWIRGGTIQSSRFRALAAAVNAQVPVGVVVDQMEPDRARLDCLFPEERAAIANSVISRQLEFAAGRQLARRLLRRLGHPQTDPIPVGAGRAPDWPEGFVGSITHCRELCLVALSPVHQVRSLGLDVEPEEAVEPRLDPVLFDERERRQLPADHGRTMAFCAKESVFKAIYPLARVHFDYRDVTVSIAGSRFHATLRRDIGAFSIGSRIEGSLISEDGMIVAIVALRAVPRG